ncbi:CpaE family protein [Aestuariibius sp. 2305UL40-4]|uniref:AAA family ATPase n=1 Tax=Aestuariibius violaceus TaxID=3234132 RepID=UPI00345EB339
MSSNAVLQTEPQPIVACTISRDVQRFDLLIEDMESVLGESWGDLTFDDAIAFLDQPEAAQLEFVAVAVDDRDESSLALITDIVKAAKQKKLKVIVIADDITPGALHTLMGKGGDEFVPYPLPEGELANAIERIRRPDPIAALPEEMQAQIKKTGNKDGKVIAVHGMAGGTGATLTAVNLAWELANTGRKKEQPEVCLIDLDLQQGSVATYLDLPRRETIFELLSDTENMDSESFVDATVTYGEKMQVLTSPTEMLPLDFIDPADVERIVEMARTNFDFVIIDMPSTIVPWTETVLNAAQIYLATLELEMRSAQNTQRMKRLLQSEELPFEKFRFILNRAPKGMDLNGKSRVKRLGESLGISLEVHLPDGGRQVVEACDHGAPLAEFAGKLPLRKEFSKLAQSIYEVSRAEAVAQ